MEEISTRPVRQGAARGYPRGRVTTILLRVSDFSNKFQYSSLGVQINLLLVSGPRNAKVSPVEVVVRIASLI